MKDTEIRLEAAKLSNGNLKSATEIYNWITAQPENDDNRPDGDEEE